MTAQIALAGNSRRLIDSPQSALGDGLPAPRLTRASGGKAYFGLAMEWRLSPGLRSLTRRPPLGQLSTLLRHSEFLLPGRVGTPFADRTKVSARVLSVRFYGLVPIFTRLENGRGFASGM